MKRSHWPLGRIVETLPGPDNIVRVVKVKTKDSGYVRSVASLELLECSNDRVWCSLMRYCSVYGSVYPHWGGNVSSFVFREVNKSSMTL